MHLTKVTMLMNKIASSYSLIDKYSNLPSNAINPSWVISKNKDIFIIEATGIDVIRAKRSMYNENKVNRLYGVTGIFLPGDHTRSFNWYEKLQKANTVSYYKDADSGNTFSYKDEIVEVFFTPAENAIERFGYPALTIEAKKNAKKQVCARWLGEQTTHVCSKTINTVKANQLFITQHEEAALAIFKELAPKAVLEVTKESVLAYNKQCLTKEYCNFPAASFITAIYNNNYTDFTAQNESFTQNMLERYKNHLLVTNVLLQKMGFETPKKNTLNLFPYFAEYYLHLFDKKYPNCNRAQQTLSIRSDTQAYNIVDQDDNVIERHDSVALYSDYKIPITMVPMCNQICGQTGPSRTLSDFSNMMAHPSMVKILDGVHKTMDTFSCDSPEILTLEAGILGIFKSLKEKPSQKAFQERSSLL